MALNKQSSTRFAGNTNAAVVDFHTFFNDQAANPEKYGLTNVGTPACPMQGIGADGLAVYNAPTCTTTSLSAIPPPAVVAGRANW